MLTPAQLRRRVRRYRVSRAADVTRDLDLVEEQFIQVYQEFGDDLENAMDRAVGRIDEVLTATRTITAHPYQGIKHPEFRPSIRILTNKSFVFDIEIDGS